MNVQSIGHLFRKGAHADMVMDQEWEKRVLCSDESCIGTIGTDGRCRECGLAYEGTLPDGFRDIQINEDSAPMATQEQDETDLLTDEMSEAAVDEDQADAEDPDDEWARRILCGDESCIGVIDEKTGRCKECGKSLQGA